MYFFTADEHYGHSKMMLPDYANRPFSSVEEMDQILIERHNGVVNDKDIVVHVGDFTLRDKNIADKYIKRLKGSHIFIRGSHDYWMKGEGGREILEFSFGNPYYCTIVACHYAMRVWPKSHYNSWQIYAHSHGGLKPVGKQWDVGVDNNNFTPVSLDQLKLIMDGRPDNWNLIKKERHNER